MIQEWSTPKFALFMVPSVFFIGYILSQFFNPEIITAIGVGTTIVSLLVQHHWKTTSQDTNDREKDDAEDTTDQRSSDEGQEADNTTDLEQKLDDNTPNSEQNTEDAAEMPTSRRQSSLLRSNEDIIEEVEDKLGDHVKLYDDGTIEIENVDDLNLYSRMMLYVIAKRIAYEHRLVETPAVIVKELREEVGERHLDYNRMEVVLFLDMAGGRLTPSHNVNLWTHNDYNDLENIEFSVNLKKISEITDWTLEEQQSSTTNLSSDLGTAAGWLKDARDKYNRMKKKQRTESYYGPEQDFESICDHVLTACGSAKAYPVEIERDGNWDKFTRYSEGVLRGVDSISHHLPTAQKNLENMKDIANEERSW